VNEVQYREVWHCPIPDSDTYRVLRQWWDEDYTVRHIYEAEAIGQDRS